MNKTDKKIEDYLDRANTIVVGRVETNEMSMEVVALVLIAVVGVAMLIQREEENEKSR